MVEIRALIKDKLAGLGGSQPLIGSIFEYGEGEFTAYPAAVILPTGGSQGETIDTHRIHRTFSFIVTLYQEQTEAGKSKEEANDIMSECVDQIIEAFDRDKNFNFEVEVVQVVKMDFNFKQAQGTYDFATFQIDVRVIVPNYPQ